MSKSNKNSKFPCITLRCIIICAYLHVICPQVVAARGCAYVVMVHRGDAARALRNLKDSRIAGHQCKVRNSYYCTPSLV